jgi:trimethylamine--corrinoid protein Co-methyltransferase
VELIHESSLQVLAKTGVRFWDRRAIDVLERAGAETDKKSDIVRFPRSLIEETVKKAPKEILLAGRDRKFDLRLGDGRSYFGTLGTAPLVIDLKNQERRYARKSDLEDFARVAESLEHLRYFHTSVTPTDLHPSTVDIQRWAIALRSTQKHCMGAAVYNLDNMPFLIRILEKIAGGSKELAKRPLITATECSTTEDRCAV